MEDNSQLAPLPQETLAGEKIYYDRGTVLRQLGVFHEPQTVLGQISLLATHPGTLAQAFFQKTTAEVRGLQASRPLAHLLRTCGWRSVS